MDGQSPNQLNHGFAIFGGDGIYLTDIKAFDVFGDGVSMARGDAVPPSSTTVGEVSRNVHVVRAEIAGTARQGLGVVEGDGVWFEDSVIRNSWYAGIDLEIDVPGEQWNQTLKNIHILRNHIDGYLFAGITIPVAGITGQVDGIELRGNVTDTASDSCYPAVQIWDRVNTTGAAPTYMLNIVTADNTLKTQGDGVRYNYVQGGSITGNTITITRANRSVGFCNTADRPAEPVRVENSTNVTVSGNTPVGY